MSVTIPPITAIPNALTMNESEYNTAWNTLLSELDPYANAANALAAEVEANALDAEAAVASLASAKWVSGSFVEGDVRWSPTDFLNYRCKNTGSRTIDPALDPANWVLLTKTCAGGSDTTSSAVDITLISTSGRLQIIAMTATAKKVTLPSASTLQKGAPIFVIRNVGLYRFSIHKTGGEFLCYADPGQIVALHCSDISTGAGIWHVSGQDVDRIYSGNTAEVLNSVASSNIAVVMLSPTKAVCAFRNDATTFLNAVVLNYGAASGVPAPVNGESSFYTSIAAQTSSQVTIVYKTSTGVTKGYVLDITGNTFIPGPVATIDPTAAGAGTAITALSSTKLLCCYINAVPSSNYLRERVLDISSSAITPSAEAAADTTPTQADALVFCVRNVGTAKALVAFKDFTNHQIRLRLQSITGSTPAATGLVYPINQIGSSQASQFGLCVLSVTRAVVIQSMDPVYADIIITLLDISGASPVAIRYKHVATQSRGSLSIDACKLDAATIYAAWGGGNSLGADAVTIKITDDDRIIVSPLAEGVEPKYTQSTGYLACDALDSGHVMQVLRNGSTYLSAKTIEVPS